MLVSKPVLGHECDGLTKFQNRGCDDLPHNNSSTCIPIFDSKGNCEGCDDTNYNAIKYCPFCGVSLEQAKPGKKGVIVS